MFLLHLVYLVCLSPCPSIRPSVRLSLHNFQNNCSCSSRTVLPLRGKGVCVCVCVSLTYCWW